MKTIKNIVDPFDEVNYRDLPDGSRRVEASVAMERVFEGAKTGIAIDASAFFQGAPSDTFSPVAQKMCAYLARKWGAEGSTTVICWSSGIHGAHIEEVGELTAEEAERYHFTGLEEEPHGTGTRLLLPLRYFVERPYFAEAKWGMYLFITAGTLDDLEGVKAYCLQLAKDIKARKRDGLKLVLLGLGPHVREEQMAELA
ncbi:MAG: hypothetical protein ACETWB_06550, partial [Anaerolineae bacterium]